jgi:hypothetical protein
MGHNRLRKIDFRLLDQDNLSVLYIEELIWTISQVLQHGTTLSISPVAGITNI